MLLSRKLLFYQNLFPKFITAQGSSSVLLIPGTYYVVLRGSGGAKGEDGGNRGNVSISGVGGAGGKGKITSKIITINAPTTATAYIGEVGKSVAEGGNGGTGGTGGNNGVGAVGGNGGGGAEPTYFLYDNTIIDVDGGAGGGGGGGGGSPGNGRYEPGSGSGAGGGRKKLSKTTGTSRDIIIDYYYAQGDILGTPVTIETIYNNGEGSLTPTERYSIPAGTVLTSGQSIYIDGAEISVVINNNNITFTIVNCRDTIGSNASVLTYNNIYYSSLSIINIPGQNGTAGGNNGSYDGDSNPGITGNTTEFPGIYSGHGGGGGYYTYHSWHGGAEAYGAGASGGSGEGGAGNEDYSFGGPGGGGAGGDETAGGGTCGSGRVNDGNTNAFNATTIPVDTTAENLLYGITGNYGTGEGSDTPVGGFIYITMINSATRTIDLGGLFYLYIESSDDAGSITGTVDETDDAGSVDSVASETDDAGSVLTPYIPTVWDLGDLSTATTTKDLGTIL